MTAAGRKSDVAEGAVADGDILAGIGVVLFGQMDRHLAVLKVIPSMMTCFAPRRSKSSGMPSPSMITSPSPAALMTSGLSCSGLAPSQEAVQPGAMKWRCRAHVPFVKALAFVHTCMKHQHVAAFGPASFLFLFPCIVQLPVPDCIGQALVASLGHVPYIGIRIPKISK